MTSSFSAQKLPTFVYSPLDYNDNQIRLLRLLPSQQKVSTIECELEHISLDVDSPPEYEALSYTWGSNAREEFVVLNGAVLPVTISLLAALRTLRQTDKDRVLWVDAVCIDQENVPERNREVPRIRLIYGCAERVVVWLSEESGDTMLVKRHLEMLSFNWLLKNAMPYSYRLASTMWTWAGYILRAVYAAPFHWDFWIFLVASLLLPKLEASYFKSYWTWMWVSEIYLVVRAFIFSGFSHRTHVCLQSEVDRANMTDPSNIEALNRFFSHRWFCRVWILQELTVAKEAIFVCGEVVISWETIARACVQMSLLIQRTSIKSPYLDSNYFRAFKLCELRENKQTAPGGRFRNFSLLGLLINFRTYEASDPRDKIYAILGLFRHFQDNEIMPEPVKVDYESSVPKIYAEFVKYEVQRTNSLEVLRICESVCQTRSLPSWVPDWTYQIRTRGYLNSPRRMKLFSMASRPIESVSVAKFSADLTTMTIYGFVIGYICDDGENAYKNDGFIEENPFGLLEKVNLIACIPAVIVNFTLLLRGFHIFRLFWNISFIYFVIALLPPASFKTMAVWVEETFHNLIPLSKDVNRRTEFVASSFELRSAFRSRGHNTTPLKSFSWQLTLESSVSDYARCISVAAARSSDLICTLVGASELYILRKEDQMCRLIGFTSLNDLDQQFMRDCEREHLAGKLSLEEFALH